MYININMIQYILLAIMFVGAIVIAIILDLDPSGCLIVAVLISPIVLLLNLIPCKEVCDNICHKKVVCNINHINIFRDCKDNLFYYDPYDDQMNYIYKNDGTKYTYENYIENERNEFNKKITIITDYMEQ